MAKRAVSVTLESENLLWLRAQARATKRGSLSATLDALIGEIRATGRVADDSIRSVVGTVDIAESDPWLEGADADLRSLVDRSLSRPYAVKESVKRRG